ncbi:MbtH family NRPS accessory protein [Streptomyces sp. NPDC090025]|uniref:MbtH family NRPS accessory protein n=1 Tax=Streptomyces sp. NPDC090025 TaxID=3365922 RepID=UPI0038394577
MSTGHDTPERRFLVLVDSFGRHAMWPAALDTPVGWPVAHGPALRADCLDFIRRAPNPGRPVGLAAAA